MDKDKIMDAMGHIDPALIEEAGREASPAKRGRRGWRWAAVIAACLCAVLAGTAVASEISVVRIVDVWSDQMRTSGPDGPVEEVSGVTISRGIRYFSIGEFSREIIRLNRDVTEPTAMTFPSWEEMEDFVGIRVMENPVLDEVHSGSTIDVGLPGGEGRFVADFRVTPMDGIVRISLYGCYSLLSGSPELRPWDGINITVSAELAIDTEDRSLDDMRSYHKDDTTVTHETYVTPNGLNVLISKAEIPQREGDIGIMSSPAVDWYTAYFTLDGIFFSVTAVDYKDFNGGNIPAGLVEETLKEVLDGFVC